MGERAGVTVLSFLKKNTVAVIAFIAAVITVIFVPFDKEYVGYFDFKTLTCLFCVSAVVAALKNINFFYILAYNIVRIFKNARACVLALVYVTFIGSMLIANDMALITFLPLGYLVLTAANKSENMAFTFIMQNIAANLGGMLTPFGNPQNLYLYTKFNIPALDFTAVMIVPFIISVALITVCCFVFVKKEKLEMEPAEESLPPLKTVVYLILFALSVLVVFRAVPYVAGLVAVPLIILVFDRKALLSVDYPLLFTFVFFFVFAGNVSRIPIIGSFISSLTERDVFVSGVLSCQVISNVPSAILLSRFTENWRELLLAVNIGGVGTIISSLASLITFREYLKHNPKKALSYLIKFSAFNFSFLVVLSAVVILFLR